MIRIIPFLSFVLFYGSIQSLFAQEIGEDTSPFPMVKVDHSGTTWYIEMMAEHPNVLFAETEFNAYFTLHQTETSHQKRAFIRWLDFARLSIDADGYYIPYTGIVESKSSAGMTKTFGTWRMTGPNFAEQTTCGTSSSLSGGFCDRVYINPYNTNNLYAGFSYGGLWVSQDQGLTWSLTDAEYTNGTNTYANRDYYYGEIEVSASNPVITYAATEAGLLKSENAGEDWSLCEQLNRDTDPLNRPYYIAVSGTDENTVLSTFGRKLYRSTDGGTTWTIGFDNAGGGVDHYFGGVHSINSEFGIYQRPSNFFGLERDMDDPNVYYLGAYNAANSPCIYKSTDGGISFTLLVNLNVDLGRTLPNNLAFQTITDNPDQLYLYSLFTEDTLYRYSETGTLNSKNRVGKTEGVKVNPLNEDNIYTGYYFASSVNRSYDGGLTYTDMTSGYGGCPKYVHPDIRSIDVIGDLVFIGTDGGLSISTDAMETVTTIGREISSVDLWGFSSSPKSDILSAGCDHGPTKIRRYDGDNGWISRGGGDASRTSVNQSHDRLIYFNHGYGKFKTALDNEGGFIYNTAITTSMLLQTLEFNPYLYNTFYGHAGSKIYLTRDNLDTEVEFADFGTTVNEFKISPEDTLRMYVLHGNNTVEKSTNGGLTWTTITPSPLVSEGYTNIVGLTVGNDPNELWLAYGNYQNDAKVLYSPNAGLSWVNLTTASLPLTPVSHIIHQRGTNGGVFLAFAGNAGVWYKSDDMPDWISVGTGLATMGYVRDIFTVPPKGKFRMGSSRGSWEHDLVEESLEPIASFSASSRTVACPVTPIYFVQNAVHSSGEATYNWEFPGGYPSESSDAFPTVYYSTPGSYNVTFTVTDEFGTVDTKTLYNFITVLDNSCPDSDGDGINDYDEATGCSNSIPGFESIEIADSLLVTDFSGETGTFFIEITLGNNCDLTQAQGKFTIDLEANAINPWSYQHFGSAVFIDPLISSELGAVQTSGMTSPAEIAFKLLDDILYVHLRANDCDTGTIRMISACWSSIDADGDGIPNSEDLDSDNDGLPDYTENTPCYEVISFDESLTGVDSVLVYTFEEGLSFAELHFTSTCFGETASLKTHINTSTNSISPIEYHHFNDLENELIQDLSNRVTSVSSDVSKLRFELIGSALYAIQLSTACGGGLTVDPACHSELDYDGDGILNYLDLDSDADGLTDADESTYCDYTTPISPWFSASDSTLIVDLASIPSTTNQYYISINAHTNCYGLTATLNAVVDLADARINASYFNHYSPNNEIVGNGTNAIQSVSSSYAKPRFSLIGTELYLVQVSNACGSVMRLNASCITPLDSICEPGHPNYLYSGYFETNASICECDVYTFGGVELTEAGIYTEDFTSIHGCDSVVTLNLAVDDLYTETTTAQICSGDTLIFGESELTESGIYTQTFATILGCDSIVTLELTVIEINTSLSTSGWTINAVDVAGASYNWVDCDAAYSSVIPAVTAPTFNVTSAGNYAVIIEQDGCVDTSACFLFDDARLDENDGPTVIINPNPSTNNIHVILGEEWINVSIELTDLSGRIVFKGDYTSSHTIDIDLSRLAAGEYILTVKNVEATVHQKVIKL